MRQLVPTVNSYRADLIINVNSAPLSAKAVKKKLIIVLFVRVYLVSMFTLKTISVYKHVKMDFTQIVVMPQATNAQPVLKAVLPALEELLMTV